MNDKHHVEGFFAENPSIEFVFFHFVTLSGTLHGRAVTKRRCLDLASRAEPITGGVFSLIGFCPWRSLEDNCISGFDNLHPDWTTLRALPRTDAKAGGGAEEASVLCNVSEEFSGHPKVDKSQPFLRCPRHTLGRVTQFASAELGIEFLVGFEIEFYLVEPETAAHPITAATRSAYGPRTDPYNVFTLRGPRGDCVRDCARKLEEVGIPVEQFHTCGGPWQYEISTACAPVVDAVDAAIQSLEIVRRTAIRHGFKAVFLPEPFRGFETCGLHMHLSMKKDPLKETRATGDKDRAIRDEFVASSFLAGMLDRLPLLCALGLPHELSYSRVAPIVAGRWVCWGRENRDVPIRQVDDMHWEFRPLDATANLYLAAAAVLAAGLAGVRSKTGLSIAGSSELISSLSDETRKERGVDRLLPCSLTEALKALDDATFREGLSDLLGTQMLDYYGAVKRGEQRSLAKMTEAARLEMYFEMF